MDTLCFAICPTNISGAHINQLAHEHREKLGLGGWPLTSERLYVSVRCLGNFANIPDTVIAAAVKAAAAVSVPPFKVEFSRAGSVPSEGCERPYALFGSDDIGGLGILEHALGVELQRASVQRIDDQPYRPHLTLLYDDQEVVEHDIPPIGWMAREVLLMHVAIGKPQFTPLARWLLRGSVTTRPQSASSLDGATRNPGT